MKKDEKTSKYKKIYKSEILKSGKYKKNKDLLTSILKDETMYTAEEIDNIIKQYLEGVS